ncbi:pilus assembly PilX family protein [Deefgea rivuli]|uniref:pilus assembly PilX family protein n=1 Tax=Deefgea rivuli TaxID=400948 RepID=UPI000A067ABC|nr:PilX N-terminal domain-containing pilus assembly protein [Deefgea rivuli]
MKFDKQNGFILIISLILLVVVTILVVNGMRNTIMNEKMSGNYMDRNRAYQAAEQALRQGSALLQANADSCLDGCTNSTVTGVGSIVTAMPSVWSDTNSKDIVLDTTSGKEQLTSAKFLINQLPDSMRPTGKESCKAYSIMGRGQGIDARSVVMLQTTAFVCPL